MHLVLTLLLAVALDSGLGEFHWKVTTTNAEAQAFFDQGMKYVYAFNHESAVRSFGEAARLDPNLAMAHWGMALALGPNINLDVDPEREKEAYQAVQTALKLSSPASPKERDLIAALATRYSIAPDADLKKLIHAVEASQRPERAAASAERLRTLAPAAGHLVPCRRTSFTAPATTRERRRRTSTARAPTAPTSRPTAPTASIR